MGILLPVRRLLPTRESSLRRAGGFCLTSDLCETGAETPKSRISL